jgi:hypothetical protein
MEGIGVNRRAVVAGALAASVCRIDAVLKPWGFKFEFDGIHLSHTGPFGSGHYRRDATRIGLSCRDSIDNVYYEHSFVTLTLCSRQTERFTISHAALMRGIGRFDDCRLLCSDGVPDAISARDGGDRIAALIHDLGLASAVLREPCERFYEIVRLGFRGYSVD